MSDAARVIVVGSVNTDLMVRLPKLPQPGEAVIGGEYTQGVGGKGANKARAAARLGASVLFVGAVGCDSLGETVRATLQADGVDLRYLRLTDRPTAVALGMVDRVVGQNMWGIDSGANDLVTGEYVRDVLRDGVRPSDVIVADNEVPPDAVVAASEVASEHGATFVLNPAPGRQLAPAVAACCGVIIPNEIEVHQLGYADPAGMLAAGAGAVIVTRGRDGADLHTRTSRGPLHAGALPVEALDSTGAGDAFVGAVAVALAERLSLETALAWGVATGSLTCRAVGACTSMPTRAELEAALRG